MDFRTLTTVGRFKDIIVILVKYGFDEIVERLDLPGKSLVRRIHRTDKTLTTSERIRFALEDLGPTFVKLGQMMSLRPDLLPAPLIAELSRLQDEVSPLDFEEIRVKVERELGQPLEQVFSEFEMQPLAAASLSQVHRAVVRDSGHVVSVKVQRPGIRKTLEKDLDMLEVIAHRLHERSEDLRSHNLPQLVAETRRILIREVDFSREAGHIKIARSYRKSENDLYIPEVYERYCTEKLLVMELVEGRKLKEILTTIDEPRALAAKGLHNALKQILEDGFFHADPHPGNLILSEEKGLCLVDWGMVGRLTVGDRYEIAQLLQSIIKKDSIGLTDALLSMTSGDVRIDRRRLERNLLEIVELYGSLPLKDLNVSQLLFDIVAVLRDHRLQLYPDLVIMIRALITAEGTARQIYPDLNVVAEAEHYARKWAAEQIKPRVLWNRLQRALSRFISEQRHVPRRFAQIADKVERGDLAIRFEHENLEGIIHTLENTFSRLTLGIIIAAMIIGSSMIITTQSGPNLLGFPAMGLAGYLISGLLGLWVVFNILRSRRY